MSLAGFEPATPPSELTQTHALDRAAIGFGIFNDIGELNRDYVV
jgi:hypothetical protein